MELWNETLPVRPIEKPIVAPTVWSSEAAPCGRRGGASHTVAMPSVADREVMQVVTAVVVRLNLGR